MGVRVFSTIPRAGGGNAHHYYDDGAEWSVLNGWLEVYDARERRIAQYSEGGWQGVSLYVADGEGDEAAE